jgi:hypothetical protein
VVRLVGQATAYVAVDQGRQLSAVRDVGDAGRPQMNYDEAVHRWVAETYRLDRGEIDDVTFDVQYAGSEPEAHAGLKLEIEVSMIDCTRYLFVREVSDFGRIINEVVALAN